MTLEAEDLNPHDGSRIHGAVNGINEALLKGYVSSIETENAKIEEIMRKAREACQPHVDEIKAIKKTAAKTKSPKSRFRQNFENAVFNGRLKVAARF
jgi:hypothetical protein